MITAVIFDMYETLITLWYSNPYMGREIAADAGIQESKFREIWDATDDDRSLGILTFEEVIERILKANNRYSDELYHRIVRKRKESKLEAIQHMHTDIVPMLKELKQRGIKIGLITNCFNEEKEAIHNCELYNYFDVACMSCELGLKKPDRQIFDLCIERLGVNAEECLYCGDGGSRELEVAKSMNMLPIQALWYLKDEAGQPVGRLKDFAGAQTPMDILRILDEYCISQKH